MDVRAQRFLDDVVKRLDEPNRKKAVEFPVNKAFQFLFGNKKLRDSEITKGLIALRKSHGLDFLMKLPHLGKPPMIRFWKIKADKLLPEDTNGDY